MKALNTKLILILLAALFLGKYSIAQDNKPEDKPVRFAWNSELLIDNQSPLMQTEGTLQLVIHHRFGTFDNGLSDLYGIYAPSNIRLGLRYGIKDWLSLGIGTEKNNKMQDLNWKVKLLKQTRSGRMPVDLTYIGNVVVDARNETFFGTEYSFTNRLSYFHQIMVSRKISDRISAMLAASYTHFNFVDSVAFPGMEHDKLGLSLGGRYNFYNEMSFIFEYDLPIDLKGEEEEPSKPNLGFGLEIGTSTHAFQVFMANYSQIINQKNIVFNKNDFTSGDWLLGFNIVVRF